MEKAKRYNANFTVKSIDFPSQAARLVEIEANKQIIDDISPRLNQ